MRWLLTALLALLAAPAAFGQQFTVERFPTAPASSWHRHQCPNGHVYAHAGGDHICPICGTPTSDVIYEGNLPIMAYSGQQPRPQPRAPQYASAQPQYAIPYPAPPSRPMVQPRAQPALTLVVCSYDRDQAGNPAFCRYCAEQLQVPISCAAPAEVRLLKNDWTRFADWKVATFPTLILFRNGVEVRRHVGLMTEVPLRKWLDETIAAPSPMSVQMQPYVMQGGGGTLPAQPSLTPPAPQPYGGSYRAADGSIVIPVPFNIQMPPPITVTPSPLINVIPYGGAPTGTPQFQQQRVIPQRQVIPSSVFPPGVTAFNGACYNGFCPTPSFR